MPSAPSRATFDDAGPGMPLEELIARCARRLGALADPQREAQSLAAALLGLSRVELVLYAQRAVARDRAIELLAAAGRRSQGVPLAYLSGRREFWSLELEVGPEVLVPRPETELVVESALRLGESLERDRAEPLAVVDLGTGSGAIALAVARERPRWRVHASDRCPAALALAQRNAARLGLQHVRFAQGDWLDAWPGLRFDLVLSNPPYVADDDPALGADGVAHEPRSALTPGTDALEALRRIASCAPTSLARPGAIVLEHGATQAAAVAALLVAQGFAHVVCRPDLAGLPRCTEGHWA